MDISGKLALVTGAGSGIGRAVVHGLAAEGCRVIGIGRTEPKLRETISSFKGKAHITAKVVDVGSREAVEQFVSAMNEKFGAPDILVNNAGVNVRRRRVAELDPDDWDYLVRVNLSGPFYLTRLVLPAMQKRGNGLVVHISSIAGLRPSVLGGAAYSASKAGLDAFSSVLAQEEAAHGIRSTVICPGEVNTPILDDRPEPVSPERKAQMLQPEDVAAAVLFVAKLPLHVHVPELVIKPLAQMFA